MNRTGPDLDSLLGSRICHDLISPLGAISNGMELLAMAGVVEGPELALISESVDNANARIRFFRVAFGVARSDQCADGGEIASILAGLSAGGRSTISWRVQGDIARSEVKLAFLLIQCLETAMPWGGSVDITREDAGFVMTGTAERLKSLDTLWDQFDGGAETAEIEASEVHFPLAGRCASEIGRRVTVDIADGRITLTF
ncbi:histidine phosphotransferase family protein [Oceaniglobus indicus]|uniref:histidine phosphotransferase family protein n=1 Tax=Oceaniglobus indicus TaxID=2047749 RepID=UPI001F4E421D|nr:histidine phosphotransferase family protein [Oceaniglobus indicus]